MPTTTERARGAAVSSTDHGDRFAHPLVVVLVGLLALVALLALARVVTAGGDRGGPDLGPLAVGCSDRAGAVVDEVRSVSRLLEDWPARVVDGRCVALLHLDGPAADLGARTATALRGLGYRVDVAAPDPADGTVTVAATTTAGATVQVSIAADGGTTVRVTPS